MMLSTITGLFRVPAIMVASTRFVSTKAPNVIFETVRKSELYKSWFNIHGPKAEEVVKDLDLSDKKCLITGGNTGIGLEMVRCLLKQRCNVLIACRNPYAATQNTKDFENNHLLQAYETNLASLTSVKTCTDKLVSQKINIDIVILNAGIFGLPWSLTKDGVETIFQVNFLSQYYLVRNIERILAPDARVVFLSSESHRHVRWDQHKAMAPTLDMLSLPEKNYTSIRAYNVSKLCHLLAMHYLGYRWLRTGKSVFCAHPGSFVKTGLCNNWWVYEALYTCMRPFSKSIAQAASTPLYCATSPELVGLSAMYFKNLMHAPESDLGRDSHLSFRVMELTRDLLAERAEFTQIDPIKRSLMKPAQNVDTIAAENKKGTEVSNILTH